MKYTQLFPTIAERNAFDENIDYISYTVEDRHVDFHKPFFCKLTLNNDEVVEIEGSGEITSTMIQPYKSTLVSAEIGNLCTSIGDSAFTSCSRLTNVIISDSVTIIGNYAFRLCSGLTTITIGRGVTNIYSLTFQLCSSLNNIISLAIVAPNIFNTSFYLIKTKGTLYVPQGSTGYDVWMGTGDFYLGKYSWTKVEQ